MGKYWVFAPMTGTDDLSSRRFAFKVRPRRTPPVWVHLGPARRTAAVPLFHALVVNVLVLALASKMNKVTRGFVADQAGPQRGKRLTLPRAISVIVMRSKSRQPR